MTVQGFDNLLFVGEAVLLALVFDSRRFEMRTEIVSVKAGLRLFDIELAVCGTRVVMLGQLSNMRVIHTVV